MRATTTPVFLLTLALAACGDASLVSASDVPTFARVGADVSSTSARPIHGRCELIVTPISFIPPIIRQSDTGTCQISHLGRSTFAGTLEINLATGTQRGERTLTAANGDILRLVSIGRSVPIGPGLVSFSATFTFVGGTGRFANATGQARGEGTANLVTRATSLTLDGSIAYDASDRSSR